MNALITSALLIATTSFPPLYNVENDDLPHKAEKLAKSVAVLQMYKTNRYFNEDVLIYKDTQKTLFDPYYVKQYAKKLAKLRAHIKTLPTDDRATFEQSLTSGWRKGTEKALFLLDYGTLKKIKEGYKSALSDAYTIAHSPDLFPDTTKS